MCRCIDCQYFNADMEMPWCNTYDQDVDPFDGGICSDYTPNEATEKQMGILLLEAEHRAEQAERAVERLIIEILKELCPPDGQPGQMPCDTETGKVCEKCWKAWAMKEGN